MIKTDFYDKNLQKIKVGDCLIFNNSSKYVVIKDGCDIVLKSLSNTNMPLILLSKITFGNVLDSALRLYGLDESRKLDGDLKK